MVILLCSLTVILILTAGVAILFVTFQRKAGNKYSLLDIPNNDILKIPDIKTIIYRYLCLYIIVTRADFEIFLDQKKVTMKEAKKNWGKIEKMIKDEKLMNHFSPKELKLIKKKLGAWNERDKIDASWRSQAMGIIAWSLGLIGYIPPYDDGYKRSDTYEVFKKARTYRDVSKVAKLRSKEEIARERTLAFVWHWRSVQERMIRDKLTNKSKGEIYRANKSVAKDAYKKGLIDRRMSGDFILNGKPYFKLTEDEFRTAVSNSLERHFALNWLCGTSKSWDETPTDT